MELRDAWLRDENDWGLACKGCDYKMVAAWGAASNAGMPGKQVLRPWHFYHLSNKSVRHRHSSIRVSTATLVTDFFTGIALALFTRQAALGALQTYNEPVVLKGA
jgi:hypothetical protein